MKAFDFLAELNEPRSEPVVTTTTTVPAPSLEPATSRPGEPVHPLDAWLAGQDLGQWTYADGRLSGPDADAADDWDSLPDPEPCKVCGGLDCWWTPLGKRRCSTCYPPNLERSRRLAERARRLQKATV